MSHSPRFLLALPAILWLAFAPVAAAGDERQVLSPRQNEIMRLVGGTDGYVNAALHQEFWSGFPKQVLEDPRIRARLTVDFSYLPKAYESFQRELWNSARLSLEKGDLLSTPGYAKAKQRLLQFTDIAAFEAPAFEAAVSEADDILRAAATGTPYSAGQASMPVDAQLVDKVLAGMDAAESRLTRLLDPDYPDLPHEWKYPEGHFRIFWPDPLIESRVAIPEGGYGREVVVYANRFDRDVYVSVQFLSLFKAENDPIRAILYGKLVASQMGFHGAEAMANEWEDRPSALVNAAAELDGTESELSLRLILAPEHEGAWVLICLAQDRPGFAAALRGNLEGAVRPE